jgi:PAS domain S-box-containing protein
MALHLHHARWPVMPKQKRPQLAKRASRTHLKADERADLDVRLRQAEERLRLFMENVKEYAIFMLDPAGRVVDWNLGAEHVLGYGDEILGQPFAIFFPPDDTREGVPECELKKAAESGQSSDDRWHVRKNGSYFWAYGITTAMRDQQGTLKGFVKVLRDSTDRKRFEEQLREKNRALEEADRLKDEFLAMLAHELRNPLAPIFNALAVLQHASAATPVAEHALSIIDRQARSLARLVDDLLDVSRVTVGKIELRRSVVDFRDSISQAIDVCRPALEARRQRLTVSLTSEPLWIDADATRIEQVVANLLNNAMKYTNDGGLIQVMASADGDQAVLTVQDSGIGIPADFLSHVFELFAQGDRALGRPQGGLGVGLTLVRKLVDLHGGTVLAKSEGVGEGSEFVVRLPRHTQRRRELHEADSAAPRRAYTPLRIVVVDDNMDAAESVAMMLSMSGHDVQTAYSAADALDKALAQTPSVMFLDIGMPGMDGYELAERLRRTAGLESTILVATTGYGQEEAKQRGMRAGFTHYLVKPIDPQKVEDILESIGRAQEQ